MRLLRSTLVLSLLIPTLTGCVAAVDWDPLAREPGTPQISGDPNDANNYYQHGLTLLEKEPLAAADAFHHASRIDPTWGTPVYARRIALLMSNMYVYDQYTQGVRKVITAPGVERLDSLYFRALVLNPFPPRSEDVRAFRALMMYRVMQDLRREYPNAILDEAAISTQLDRYLRRAGPGTRAWMAHSEGRYSEAADLYRQALKSRSTAPYLRVDLARVLLLAGRPEEARAEMQIAVDELRSRDEDELVRLYESKALYEYSIGRMLEDMNDVEGARASYSRALEEDLSYHPAHMRLAELAFAEGDTLTAISTISLAAEIQPDDPTVHYQRGRLLASAGEYGEAETALRRSIAIEPLFAKPYLSLAGVLQDRGDLAGAVEQYRAYLEREARGQREAREAGARLEELETQLSGSR